jgi:predicted lactoylglutathione lyase
MNNARINVITLGVKDIQRSRRFYEDLGFLASSASNEHFVAFQTPGIVFCLYPITLLAEDASVDSNGSGFRGLTVSINVGRKEEVQEILEEAKKCGAAVVKEAQDVFWGGHSGYFTDPDGHFWEIAWNPHWLLKESGLIELPK